MSRSLRIRDRIIQVGAGVALLAALELLARAFVPLPAQDRYRFFRLHGADGLATVERGAGPVAFLARTHALLEDDDRRLWRLRADLALDAASLSLDGTQPWSLRTNADGWRGRPSPDPDAAAALELSERPVVCYGDSSTFGWGVDEGQAFPEQLDGRTARPVYNRGVPGWSSVQGASLAREQKGALNPLVVVAAFGANDGHQVPRSDRDWLAARETTLGQLRHMAGQLRLVTLARHHLYPLWVRLQAVSWQAGATVPRADTDAYRRSLELIIGSAPHTVLVDVCAEDRYGAVMAELSRYDPRVTLIRYDDVHGETIDGCHPTAPGHQALAGAIAAALPQ